MDFEEWDEFDVFLDSSWKCIYESVEINYLVLQDTASNDVSNRAKYVYVDFTNPKANIVTTKKIALGEHVKGEYGVVRVEVPGIRIGLSKEETTTAFSFLKKKHKGTFDSKKWKEFLASIKPKLICRPQEDIQTIWLSN